MFSTRREAILGATVIFEQMARMGLKMHVGKGTKISKTVFLQIIPFVFTNGCSFSICQSFVTIIREIESFLYTLSHAQLNSDLCYIYIFYQS